MQTTKMVIRDLEQFTPRLDSIKGDMPRAVIGEKYSYQMVEDGQKCTHFPVLLNSDGSPWNHGTLYLLSKLELTNPLSPKTLDSIAIDLVNFKNFIDIQELNYTEIPKRKFNRPTYQYRAHLQDLISSGHVSSSTASRRMSSIINFYRWLAKQHDCHFEYSPWSEKDMYIRFSDHAGFTQMKKIKTTDLKVNVQRQSCRKHIQDGGKLRPLDKAEQERILKALVSINNPEMKLAFLIALTTGARIQTVFTLKRKDFLTDLKDKEHSFTLKVGRGTGIDTKYEKQMCIYIPNWLHKLIKTYSLSERCKRRIKKASKNFALVNEDYLFLTQAGWPYYMRSNDPNISKFRNPPRGGAVRQFIKAQLIPELCKTGDAFPFSFHDLRATYGINLLEEKLCSIEDGRDKLFDVLMLIRERMGHSSIASTERYLNYRKQNEFIVNAQSKFEKFINTMVDF
jgi:integrase